MIDGFQFLDSHRLGILDITEGNRALTEITLTDLCVDQAVDELPDILLGILL